MSVFLSYVKAVWRRWFPEKPVSPIIREPRFCIVVGYSVAHARKYVTDRYEANPMEHPMWFYRYINYDMADRAFYESYDFCVVLLGVHVDHWANAQYNRTHSQLMHLRPDRCIYFDDVPMGEFNSPHHRFEGGYLA